MTEGQPFDVGSAALAVSRSVFMPPTSRQEAHVPESGYVSLIADGKAYDLYAQFGFVHTGSHLVGMVFKRRPNSARTTGT